MNDPTQQLVPSSYGDDDYVPSWTFGGPPTPPADLQTFPRDRAPSSTSLVRMDAVDANYHADLKAVKAHLARLLEYLNDPNMKDFKPPSFTHLPLDEARTNAQLANERRGDFDTDTPYINGQPFEYRSHQDQQIDNLSSRASNLEATITELQTYIGHLLSGLLATVGLPTRNQLTALILDPTHGSREAASLRNAKDEPVVVMKKVDLAEHMLSKYKNDMEVAWGERDESRQDAYMERQKIRQERQEPDREKQEWHKQQRLQEDAVTALLARLNIDSADIMQNFGGQVQTGAHSQQINVHYHEAPHYTASQPTASSPSGLRELSAIAMPFRPRPHAGPASTPLNAVKTRDVRTLMVKPKYRNACYDEENCKGCEFVHAEQLAHFGKELDVLDTYTSKKKHKLDAE